jgi:hypothetical protein
MGMRKGQEVSAMGILWLLTFPWWVLVSHFERVRFERAYQLRGV